ncbi:thioredoxin-like protein [Obelidium mucronatum]|nr:thioredoxin-like protein [Obelidium mucronatum]
MVREVKDIEDFRKTINGDKIVIVDWFATWCGPCKAISPAFAKMEAEFPNVEFVQVDVDQIPEAAEESEISSMPTFHVYKHGKKVDEMVGAVPAKLKAMVEKYKDVILAPATTVAPVVAAAAPPAAAPVVAAANGASDTERIIALEKEVRELKERLSALETLVQGEVAGKKRKLE